MNLESIIKRYREKGIKITPQRLAILKSLDGDTSHPSAMDIYRRLKKEYPSLSLTTVYNTLDVLKDMGEVWEINLKRDKSIYDPNTEPHNHIYCIKCQRVDDLAHNQLTEVAIKEAEEMGYEVHNASVYLYGICKDCKVQGCP